MNFIKTILVVLLGASLVQSKRMKRRRFDLDAALQTLSEIPLTNDDNNPVTDDMNCDQAIDMLLLNIPSFGSIFYALLNGWYLGQWADYSSCLADATDSQYILATVSGNYSGPFQFTRGGVGKFTDGFTTRMGLCFPKQCKSEEVRDFTESLIKGYAEGVGWTNINVDYHLASQSDAENAEQTSSMVGTYGLLGVLALGFSLMFVGTMHELTTIGDLSKLKGKEMDDVVYEAAKFRRLSQYECILLQRKNEMAQKWLSFSIFRNLYQLAFEPRSLRTAMTREQMDQSVQPDKRISQHLTVFNGLKGASTILAVWGITFYFVQFSIVSNPDGVNDMSNTLLFNIVSGTVFTVPIFFFCSGFLQTFAFLQKDKDGSMFTMASLRNYYFRKVFRYMPLNAVIILATLYLLPLMGYGPIWNNFATATAGCNDNWWTNLVWINNLYPRNFDDKCLPWTWFVPCYVQISLTLPPLLALYRIVENKMVAGLFYFTLFVFALIGQFSLVYFSDLGGTMVRNDEYFAKVFMNPAFHFSSFLYGMVMCLVYLRFKKERGFEAALRNSFSSRLMEMIRHNQAPRYLVYMIGLLCMASAVVWQTPFIPTPVHNQSQLMCAIFGTFSFPLFLIGLSMIVMPALAARAAAFRFLFGSKTWTVFAHMSVGMYYCSPLIALYYFMSSQHQIHVTYYMFVYFFSGNFLFGMILYVVFAVVIDRPIHALLNLRRDVRDARNSSHYKLDEYLQNFKEEDPLANLREATEETARVEEEIVVAENRDQSALFQGLKPQKIENGLGDSEHSAGRDETRVGTNVRETNGKRDVSNVRFTKEFDLDAIEEDQDN